MMPKPVKRFMLFGHDRYYPLGGWGDFVDSFDTLDEVKAAAAEPQHNLDNYDIVDIENPDDRYDA